MEIRIDNSHLVFGSNFGGDPRCPYVKYPSADRKGNIAINDPDILKKLIDAGVRVNETRPTDPEKYEPEHYVTINLKYRGNSDDPVVYLVSDGKRRLVTEEALSIIDDRNKKGGVHSSVESVSCIANTWRRDPDSPASLWVKTMYVWLKTANDPWASMFENDSDLETEEDPF